MVDEVPAGFNGIGHHVLGSGHGQLPLRIDDALPSVALTDNDHQRTVQLTTTPVLGRETFPGNVGHGGALHGTHPRECFVHHAVHPELHALSEPDHAPHADKGAVHQFRDLHALGHQLHLPTHQAGHQERVYVEHRAHVLYRLVHFQNTSAHSLLEASSDLVALLDAVSIEIQRCHRVLQSDTVQHLDQFAVKAVVPLDLQDRGPDGGTHRAGIGCCLW